MIEPWITLAILGGIGSNIYNFLARYALKDGDDPLALAWFFEAVRFVIFGIILLFERPLSLSLAHIGILALLGITEVFSISLFAKMHSLSHLSISSIIMRLRLVWLPILAFFLLNEIVPAHGYIGILIVLVGIMVAGKPHTLTYDKGIRYAYMFSIVAALLAVILKAASAFATPALIMFAMTVPSVIFFPFIMKKSVKRLSSVLKKNPTAKIGLTLMNALSFYLYAFALVLGPISATQAVYQGMMVLSVLAGIFILKEREDVARKILGTTITLIGIYAVAFLK